MQTMQTCDVPVPACAVRWVPVMMMPAPTMLSGQLTPMLPSGQMTPVCQGQMTPMTSMQLPAKMAPPGQWSSSASTTAPSGVCSGDCSADCSDAGSDFGDDGDVAEACAELLEQIQAGGDARDAAIEALEGSVDELAFDASACRVVQAALEHAPEHVAASLALELRGQVRAAIHSPHANHVIQKMIDVLPACHTQFVLEEVIGAAAELAKHRFGSRVLTRLVHRHSCELAIALTNELVHDVSDLSRHTFAHYVMEAVLDNAQDKELHFIANALRSDLARNAKNRSGTHVVERALLRCEVDDRNAMMMELFQHANAMVSLVENQFGCHVAKSLLRIPGPHLAHAKGHFEEAKPLLQKTKYGRRLIEEFKRLDQ